MAKNKKYKKYKVKWSKTYLCEAGKCDNAPTYSLFKTEEEYREAPFNDSEGCDITCKKHKKELYNDYEEN